MVSAWQLLGIAPTDDLRAIRRAYAAKAKIYHPEEHPDAFRKLHDAYRQTARYARGQRAAMSMAAGHRARPSASPCGTVRNPRRAHLYFSPDDVLSAEELYALRIESKGLQPTRPVPPTRTKVDRVPIRGAGSAAAPALCFDAVLQDAPNRPAFLAAQVPAQKARQPHGTWIFLAIWGLLLPLTRMMPAPAATLLYAATFLASVNRVRHSTSLTFAAAAVDLLSVCVLVRLTPVSAWAILFAVLLPLLRLLLRVVFVRAAHKSSGRTV